jgi:tetratricopeptide (TPR) repeat protein
MDIAPTLFGRNRRLIVGLRARADRLSGFSQTMVATGAIWSFLALVALLLAGSVSWIGVPLIQTTGSWAWPVDVGWGITNRIFSYGLLCLLAAGLCLGYTLVAAWQPLRSYTLMLLGCLATAILLLFIWQFALVDLPQVSALAAQENQSLLIRGHLGYALAPQLLPMSPWHVLIATPGDRLILLVQLAQPGILLPLVAGLLCFGGAWTRRQDARASKHRWYRRAGWIVLGLGVIVILGRAPTGLFIEHQGQQALAQGNYHAALDRFSQAVAITPTLATWPAFQQERGAALYLLGQTTNRDVGLYLAAYYRQLGALNQAWLEDETLARADPQDPLVRQDMVQTLEQLAQRDVGAALPITNMQAVQHPQIALQTRALDRALPWLDALIQVQPDNLYAYYLRGRIFFTAHAYELAAQDFQTILSLSRDSEMQSASYTYLALCRAGLGDYASERALLKKAIQLDSGYYNTTARETASGLH